MKPRSVSLKKNKRGGRKTRRRGGGLFGLFGTASRVGVAVRNIQYIKTLENRLVNKYDDYGWVQARRKKNKLLSQPKKYYTENNWTTDDTK
jgi:hypothetical protein